MTLNDILVLAMLIGMMAISYLITNEFSKSKDNGKFKTLWVELFASKIWLYGSTAVYFTLHVFNIDVAPLAWVLFVINLPTFIAKVRLYLLIRK